MSRVSGGKIADADALGSTGVVWKVQMRGEAQSRVANQSLCCEPPPIWGYALTLQASAGVDRPCEVKEL